MSGVERPLPAWVALRLLAALVATNAVLFILLRTGGPLIGLVFYSALLWRWKKRDFRAGVIGGIAGLAVHGVEIVSVGWSPYPFLMALNLILPALLAWAAWLAMRRAK